MEPELRQLLTDIKATTHQYNNKLCVVSAVCQILLNSTTISDSDKELMAHLIKATTEFSHIVTGINDRIAAHIP